MTEDCEDCDTCQDTECEEYWKIKMGIVEEQVRLNKR
jgi:hypothetical protein